MRENDMLALQEAHRDAFHGRDGERGKGAWVSKDPESHSESLVYIVKTHLQTILVRKGNSIKYRLKMQFYFSKSSKILFLEIIPDTQQHMTAFLHILVRTEKGNG